MKFVLLVLVLLILPHTSRARLGESVEQCGMRYGKPILSTGMKFVTTNGVVNTTVRAYKTEHLIVGLVFDLGIAHAIHYLKPNQAQIDYDTLMRILAMAYPMGEWQYADPRDFAVKAETEMKGKAIFFDNMDLVTWYQPESKMVAEYDRRIAILSIYTADYYHLMMSQKPVDLLKGL